MQYARCSTFTTTWWHVLLEPLTERARLHGRVGPLGTAVSFDPGVIIVPEHDATRTSRQNQMKARKGANLSTYP